MTKVAKVIVTPAVPIQGMEVVECFVFHHDLIDATELGNTISGMVVEMLAKNVSKQTGGLVSPCPSCGAQMVMVERNGTLTRVCPECEKDEAYEKGRRDAAVQGR